MRIHGWVDEKLPAPLSPHWANQCTMLEWRLIAVSRLRIDVSFGSHGVLVSYIPSWTEQGKVAAYAGFSENARAETTSRTAAVVAARRPGRSRAQRKICATCFKPPPPAKGVWPHGPICHPGAGRR